MTLNCGTIAGSGPGWEHEGMEVVEVVAGCLDSIWKDPASRPGLIFYDKGCALRRYLLNHPDDSWLGPRHLVDRKNGPIPIQTSPSWSVNLAARWSSLLRKVWGWVRRVRRSVRGNDEGLVHIALRPHINDDLSWLRRVLNYRRARSRHICWCPQYEHATIGENKTSTAGKTGATMEVHQFFF